LIVNQVPGRDFDDPGKKKKNSTKIQQNRMMMTILIHIVHDRIIHEPSRQNHVRYFDDPAKEILMKTAENRDVSATTVGSSALSNTTPFPNQRLTKNTRMNHN
jgi:hypothetical protein